MAETKKASFTPPNEDLNNLEQTLKTAQALAQKIETTYKASPSEENGYSEPSALVKKLGQSIELLTNLKSYIK